MSSTSTVKRVPHMITVGDMKKILEKYPDDLPLITSMDEEGNGYNAVFSGATVAYIEGRYAKGYRWDGDTVFEEGSRKLKHLSQEELDRDYKKVLLVN